MSQSVESYTTNTLLSALSDADLALLKPHLTRVNIEWKQVLVTADEPIDLVYFPEGGVASIVSTSEEDGRTEVGIFGRDGVSASALILGTDRSPHETFIQVDGATALRMDADRFTEMLDESSTFRRKMGNYIQTLLIQTAQSAVANAHHRIESRLARWLLMCHDRADGDEINLTHEFMAMMIGANRGGVTISLHILEGAGMIRSKRSKVIILDREKLHEIAGESYGQPEAEYRRLIGPIGPPSAVG
ncbi:MULTISPECIES: Crp/Fnr family transcriptional regulator [Sphingobium]|jgi:CRP-like cAMP-binding protein|uniref:Crp/Fnr family transcriptional regulator n=1 Tax=Sphingobium naphthae TaxID=1886786 RepID=A0ABU4A1T8_9SPHN|nr:Crp/Fnr family transcriptional regulator [Sphingobium naphthae]MDV5825738.1 Crp/Fnr family transcriptional regulator [Sphingobium naphthae]